MGTRDPTPVGTTSVLGPLPIQQNAPAVVRTSGKLLFHGAGIEAAVRERCACQPVVGPTPQVVVEYILDSAWNNTA